MSLYDLVETDYVFCKIAHGGQFKWRELANISTFEVSIF